jgi:hypothetical protein
MKLSKGINKMELLKFIMWLTTGAVIGWFANRIVTTEHGWARKPLPVKVSSSEVNHSVPFD